VARCRPPLRKLRRTAARSVLHCCALCAASPGTTPGTASAHTTSAHLRPRPAPPPQVKGPCSIANAAGLERKVLQQVEGPLGKQPMAWVNALTTTHAATPDTVLGTWATVYGMPAEVTGKGYQCVASTYMYLNHVSCVHEVDQQQTCKSRTAFCHAALRRCGAAALRRCSVCANPVRHGSTNRLLRSSRTPCRRTSGATRCTGGTSPRG
jgi:hypothetical protein